MAATVAIERRISTIQPISTLPGPNQSASLTTSPDINPIPVEEVAPIADISPAIAMTDTELACFHAVRYILRSHKRLTDDDIQYASNYISSFYSHSRDELEINPNADNLLNSEQLVMFLVYIDQRGISKFALVFNEELDASIKAKDTVSIKKLLLGPKEMFIELYDNPYLSNEDREFISRLISRERFAVSLALILLAKKILNLETIDDKCASESMSVEAERNGDAVNMTILATKCYDEVCIQDARILEDDTARAEMSKREKPADTVFTVDKPASSPTPQAYCFETIELIAAMTEETPINPKSKEPFSIYALKIIRQRFHKEIAMYRRYKEIKAIKS